MARRPTPVDPFRLALSLISVARLKRLLRKFRQSLGNAETREEYIDLAVSTLSDVQKQRAMREDLLAGRGAMSVFKLTGGDGRYRAEANFVRASRVPSIVAVGGRGAVLAGMRQIYWATIVGEAHYLDERLVLQTDPEADVFHSFYDEDAGILQVRAGVAIARKIGRQWATLHGLDPERSLGVLGIRNLDTFHQFVDFVGGRIHSAKGVKRTQRGFHKVSGEAHPGPGQNLAGTEDYDEFSTTTDATDRVMAIDVDGAEYKIGFAFEPRSMSFRNDTPEHVYGHVYTKLREFLGQ